MTILRPSSLIRDFNAAAFWAGITTFIFMIFGALTVQISVIQRFHLPPSLEQSWIVITWLSASVATIAFVLRYRQPLGLGWTLPGLVYLGSLADRFSFQELMTANLVTGLLIVVLGILGVGSRVIRFVPLPIMMAMFAASIIDFITGMLNGLNSDLSLAGPMLAVYLFGRALRNQRVPPNGLSVVLGAILIVALGKYQPMPITFVTPSLDMPGLRFSLEAILTVTVPMVVLVLGLGNVQGLGFMIAQGYRVPANAVTVAAGIMTSVNALFGGHPAAMTRVSAAILGGPAAGPLETRYWSALVAFTLSLGVTLASGMLVTLIAILPATYILVIAGLAVLPSFEDALSQAFGGQLRFGSVIAFGVTLSSLSIAGIPSAFWAILAGIACSLVLERHDLLTLWGYQSPDRAPVAPTTT